MTWLLVLFGFLSGILGGMGMGGGTLLVPLLSFLDIPQKTIQAINLFSFLPMCAAALCVHAKNKLLRPQNVGWLVFPACLGALGGAFAAHSAPNNTLRICFALFLIAVGIWQITVAVRFAAKLRRRRTVVFSSVRCLKAISPRLLKKRRGKA